jgi:RNA polymerase sigma-70 factor, ECF subfamily
MTVGVQQRLLDQARSGDSEALGSLLQQLRPYVRMLIRAAEKRGTQGRQDDSDLIQDSMLVAQQAFPRFHGSSMAQFVAWLRTVTQRTVARCVSVHVAAGKRELSREQALVDLDQLPAVDDDVAHERAASMAAALDRLPEDMRTVLLGRFLDGLSYAVLADQLGRSEGALRVLHTRALRRLREIMAGEQVA